MRASVLGVGLGGSAVVGVAFGMTRYAYGLTLPDVRAEFDLAEPLLGLIASGTFVGYLVGLISVPHLAARRGPRAPTTVGGVCGVVGAATVAFAPSPWILAAGAVVSGSAAGWVWAPYSDIVTRTTPRHQQPTLLATITTGTSMGLIALSGLSLAATMVSWRLTWVGIALAAALAAGLNLRAVPRLHGERRRDTASQGSVWRRSMVLPLSYAVLYFAALTVYLTYATDIARDGGPTSAGPLLFGLVGLGGVTALATGRLVGSTTTRTVGVGSVGVVSGALALLGLGHASLVLVLLSAFLLGVGFMVGSSLLAIWTAEAAPDRPQDGFTVALVVGAVVSIATPAVTGFLIPLAGLPVVLVAVAVLGVAGAAVLAVGPHVHLAAAGPGATGSRPP